MMVHCGVPNVASFPAGFHRRCTGRRAKVVEIIMHQWMAFRHSLAETIAWCTARGTVADPERCLRTPALDPGPLQYDLSLTERQVFVATAIQARSRLLHDAGLNPPTPATDLAGGRLLLFDPDGTLSDGAAAISSLRFFDDDNIPPWDCWVYYVVDPLTKDQRMADQAQGRRLGLWSMMPPSPLEEYPSLVPPYYVVDPIPAWRQSYLVSWVPEVLIPLAHNGVIVNPEGCLEWLADRDTQFTQLLQRYHLLT